MSEYIDVAIIENGKVIGSFKALHKTEEKKNEMKNRISLALKDPILQQGFEIICKENAELKKKCYKKAVKDYCELEKENAQLRADYEKQKEINKELVDDIAELHKRIRELEQQIKQIEKVSDYNADQLTKAKEIIKNIIGVTWGEGWNYSLDWKVKAEEFLSCSEKLNN